MTREEAWELLTEYNKDEFHLEHAQIVEGTMRYFARELGYGDEEEFWGIVGLLHDLDFEQYPEQHCIKSQEIMREHGVDERIIHATASHGYGITVDIKPEHEMEKVLYAVDELTGLIGAVTLMRPSKSVQDLELKSVKKKYKSKGFAAGCSREVMFVPLILPYQRKIGLNTSSDLPMAMRTPWARNSSAMPASASSCFSSGPSLYLRTENRLCDASYQRCMLSISVSPVPLFFDPFLACPLQNGF